ncbi:MAG: ABC transporter permease, partial [Opitutaceae bacterium]|nr:ABC transporter permease [Opitutaceae bacterium]
MKRQRPTFLLAEVRESFSMAMAALAAHKLRSALTLLGVLVGVFSIIVTMTAMRVLKANIEREISDLGAQSFAVRKWPALYFGGPEGFEKFWRRKNITLAQGQLVEEKATLAASVGVEGTFWGGEVETRYAKTPPSVQLLGETPGSFPARGWTVADGRGLNESDVDNARDVCVLGNALAKTVFPYGSPVGERLRINGFNYAVLGVLAPKGGSLGGEQDNFAVVPVTTALNRAGRWQYSVTILVQARDAASYEDTTEQVRGLLRVARKVPPGVEDDFELFSNDSLISQFNTFTMAVRIGVSVVSSIALIAA